MSAPRTRSKSSRQAVDKAGEDYLDHGIGKETNISVVVRCRSRNNAELQKGSAVAVSTDGINGTSVDLLAGRNTLGNKKYHFDKVFSPAANQGMVFDEVVAPILDTMLSGFNCTIFAYGQTGSGKTYTMTGNISDTFPPPGDAGIIPRTLQSLFARLDGDSSDVSVRCSFLELYNEELRDLLSSSSESNPKIVEDGSRKGLGTVVLGMTEPHIECASKGIKLLYNGCQKRQVAATKCNDFSSRSHTVFTIAVYKTARQDGNSVTIGKLNLVDLAGSEDIKRSGSENKRAAEAGLINKSLLTLGRVINALVDKCSHIPYRESKLTRLLQDSLGGQTKTCIIATVSPTESNLEETIQTLNYASRAKNIRNRPQMNSVSKTHLLKEWCGEIERLRGELSATRQRNGIYLTAESYAELTTKSESRRLLSEDQKGRIEVLEINNRNQMEELLSLSHSLNTAKRENEVLRGSVEETMQTLKSVEDSLAHSRRKAAEETLLRKAHETTEENLASVGKELVSTLEHATSDIESLQLKLRRWSELQAENRGNWACLKDQVSVATGDVEKQIEEFGSQQREIITSLSTRLQRFVHDELEQLGAVQSSLRTDEERSKQLMEDFNDQTTNARDDLDGFIRNEIGVVKENAREKMTRGLTSLSQAAERISVKTVMELDALWSQLQSSYDSMEQNFRSSFRGLLDRIQEQQILEDDLRQQLNDANRKTFDSNHGTMARLEAIVAEEKQSFVEDGKRLLSEINSLISSAAEARVERIADALLGVAEGVQSTQSAQAAAAHAHDLSMNALSGMIQSTIGDGLKSMSEVETKIKADLEIASKHTNSVREISNSESNSTATMALDQVSLLETHLQSLDGLSSQVQFKSKANHADQLASLSTFAASTQASRGCMNEYTATSTCAVKALQTDMDSDAKLLCDALPTADVRHWQGKLYEAIGNQEFKEYTTTGSTPHRKHIYQTTLPRTADHATLISTLDSPDLSSSSTLTKSPSKVMVYHDLQQDKPSRIMPRAPGSQIPVTSLQHLDTNIQRTRPHDLIDGAASLKTDRTATEARKRRRINPTAR